MFNVHSSFLIKPMTNAQLDVENIDMIPSGENDSVSSPPPLPFNQLFRHTKGASAAAAAADAAECVRLGINNCTRSAVSLSRYLVRVIHAWHLRFDFFRVRFR